MIIQSSSNPHVKELRSLYTKKGREECGCFVVEGVNMVKDIPQNQVVKSLYCKQATSQIAIESARKFDCEIFVLDDALFDKVADTVTPSGLIAVVQKPEFRQEDYKKIVILDGISDAGNAGTIIRTAAACGMDAVMAFSSVDLYSPKCVRSTMGGIFRIPLLELDYSSFDFGGDIYLLDMDGENLFETTPSNSYALVVGSEAKGASPFFRQKATRVLSIPMKNDTESLNASVSAALGMYILENYRR